MLAAERRNLILEKLQEEKRVVVSQLSEQFDVSEETIRRDLDKLDKEGLATKTYGGAVLTENSNLDMSRVIIDRDVAALYGVETKRVNEAVRNNPEKFPDGYVFQLSRDESKSLRSKFSTLKIAERGQHSKYLPKAFTEKGLYMLATILKSPIATQTTLAIIETFTRFRDFTRTVSQIAVEGDEQQRKSLVARSGECLAKTHIAHIWF